jgi:hypothetical protein
MSNDLFTRLRKDMGWSDNLSSNTNGTLLDAPRNYGFDGGSKKEQL